MCGVYKIINKVNGKIYVGSSKNINQRWKEHIYHLNNGDHCNTYLQNAWNKYGSVNFSFKVIEKCEPQFQFEREQYYLNLLNPFDDNGYNVVRQISKEYMSDHYLVKICDICGKEFKTFSAIAKYCNSCRDELAVIEAEKWEMNRVGYISNKAAQKAYDMEIARIYGSMEYYWEITE